MPIGIVLIVFGILTALFAYWPLGLLAIVAGAVVVNNALRNGDGS